MQMSKKQLVIATVEHQHTPTAPYAMDLTLGQLDKMMAYYGCDAAEVFRKIDSCLIAVDFTASAHEIPGRPGFFRDDWGVVWNRSGPDRDIGVVENQVLPEPSLEGLVFPEIDVAGARKKIQDMLDKHGDKFTMVDFGFSMFERCWTLRGLEDCLADMAGEPEFIEELMDAICDWTLKYMDAILDMPFDCVFFGDDWGQQKGLIMGPGLWRRFIKPRMARLYARAKQAGKYVAQHSCGDISDIFPDLIEIGLNVYQTFQPEIYDIEKMKALYGDKLTFFGAISTQTLLPYATPQEVRSECARITGILSRNGGYIIAPTHAVPHDVPAENIAAMIDFYHQQGN